MNVLVTLQLNVLATFPRTFYERNARERSLITLSERTENVRSGRTKIQPKCNVLWTSAPSWAVLSVCLPSVTFRYRDHICWNTSKIISPPNSDDLMWRFLRNRRLLLCLHTIFRALIYWAHRAVVLAIAWHLVVFTARC